MEALTGTWELLPEETTGVDEYIDANNLPATASEGLKERGGTLTIYRQDNQWCSESADGDRKESLKFTLGEEVTHKYGATETKSTFTWENGKLVGTHIRNDRVTKSARYVNGDKLIEEITANGATIVTKYKKA